MSFQHLNIHDRNCPHIIGTWVVSKVPGLATASLTVLTDFPDWLAWHRSNSGTGLGYAWASCIFKNFFHILPFFMVNLMSFPPLVPVTVVGDGIWELSIPEEWLPLPPSGIPMYIKRPEE